MASDLSTLIQESISGTLNGLLAKDTKLIETTKVHELDIQDLEVLQVNAIFDFDKISSTLSFVIPATSASYIFNTMMGESEATTLTTIDDDTKDAIEEFVSNLSGSLTTTINGSSFDDLGGAKFNISKSTIVQGNTLSPYENMFRFLLDLEGYQLCIFLQFDKILIPHIKTLLKCEITKHDEPVIEEVKIEEKPKEEVKIEEQPKEQPKTEEPKEEAKIEEPKEESKDNSKEKKIKLIIMGLGGLIALLLLGGIIMYFMGVFDEPEPVVVPDLNVTKKIKKDQVEVVSYRTLKKVNFKITDIDSNRLNGRLAILNKNSILTPSELTKEKNKEKQRLDELNIEKQYIEFAKQNKEEVLKDIPQKIIKQKKMIQKVVQKVIKPKVNKDVIKIDKFKYIIANSLQYKLFVKLLSQTNTKTATASICSGKQGETVIFIGPFQTDNEKNKMDNLIKASDSSIETTINELTQNELDKYCN